MPLKKIIHQDMRENEFFSTNYYQRRESELIGSPVHIQSFFPYY